MEAQLLLENTQKWTEEMYDWDEEHIHNYMFVEGSNHIVYIEYSYTQIGKTREWFKNISDEIGNPLVVRREILLQRLRGSSASPYDREDIDYIIECGHQPIKSVYLQDYYELNIYEELDKSIPYLVGVDCSTGTVGDNNAFTVINPYTIEPVAEFECAFCGETTYENILKELVKKYIPRAIVIIERNSIGDGIIDHLMYSPIAGNLYFDKNKDLLGGTLKDHETIESMLTKHAKRKTMYGVYTSGASRDTMFAILSNHVSNYKEKFIGQNVIRDLSRLVKTPSGKIEAGKGFHDDSIMSYLIALYVYYHGNNLAMFGFVKGSQEIKNQNEGLTRPEDVDLRNLPESVVGDLKQTLSKKNDNYYDMMRQAVLQSQQESLRLANAKLAHNQTIDNTPDHVMDDYTDTTGSISMDFFDQMNGMGSYGKNGLW